MSSSRATEFGDHYLCPIECITKALLFVAITILILYIPLGKFQPHCDPECCSRTKDPPPHKERHSSAMCCLCDIYKRMVQVAQATKDVVEVFLCLSIKAMYEVKMKFYEVLDVLDRRDLCRAVSCKVAEYPKLLIEENKPCTCPDGEVTCKCKGDKVTCKCDKKEKEVKSTCSCDKVDKHGKITCECKTDKKVVCECDGEDESCPCF